MKMKIVESKSSKSNEKLNLNHKIHPNSNPEIKIAKNKIKILNHFLNMSKEELEKEGIKRIRGIIARGIQSKVFAIAAFILTVIYSLYIFAILASEQQIYDSKAGAMAVEIVELFFMATFLSEIAIYIIAFGPKLYFIDLLNIFDIILILLTLIWYIMDLSDSDKFREKAAFRVIRVALMFGRLRFLLISIIARKSIKNLSNKSQPSMNQIWEILENIRDNTTNAKVSSEINYWIDSILQGIIWDNWEKKSWITNDKNNDFNYK